MRPAEWWTRLSTWGPYLTARRCRTSRSEEQYGDIHSVSLASPVGTSDDRRATSRVTKVMNPNSSALVS